MHDGLAVRTRHSPEFLRTEGPPVEIDGVIRSTHRQERGDRMVTLRNRLHGHGQLPRRFHLLVPFPARPAKTPGKPPPGTAIRPPAWRDRSVDGAISLAAGFLMKGR